MSNPSYTVAVRALCEFTAKHGDLDIRFTPAPSAQEGIAAHATLAARRGAGYLKEVSLDAQCGQLRVRGRADGFDPVANRLDEFKTYRGDLARMRANHRALHWAQLKIYGALLCRVRRISEITLALVYFNIKTEKEDVLELHLSAEELDAYLADLCSRFVEWADLEVAHRTQRDTWLNAVRFPLETLRTGQRQLAEAVYRTSLGGGALMAQAPTGVGKTLGTLFPMLKAAPKAPLDKIFFLVAKTSGRRTGIEALRAIVGTGTDGRVRVLEYVSRESACEHPGKACSGEECPLALGFYDRLPEARHAVLKQPVWDRETVRIEARLHGVCPYYLAQEMLRWSDVIVGDYNYYFDTSAVLFALTSQNNWRIGVLIDEAHNLLPRARSMYSATLSPDNLKLALQPASRPIGRALRTVACQWDALEAPDAKQYTVHPDIPATLVGALATFVSTVNDHLDGGAALPAPIQNFYFEALHFARMADAFGAHSLFDATRGPPSEAHFPATTLCIRNVAPGPFLAPRFAGAAACVAFSATLMPREFHRQLLGLPDDTAWADVASPFTSDQLTVHVQSHISTRFHRRDASLAPIADLIARQYAAEPGTYLAFFSSFDYLDAARCAMQERYPHVPLWSQVRQMSVDQRDGFLARFTPGARGIGFAVLGGLFAEGIDLAGCGLAGAFIATLGLPQINGINAEFERRMQQLFGAGYEFTYLYPGLQKVVQAAGRVIRGPTDRGTLHLIDDRFLQPQIRQLLPAWWELQSQ